MSTLHEEFARARWQAAEREVLKRRRSATVAAATSRQRRGRAAWPFRASRPVTA